MPLPSCPLLLTFILLSALPLALPANRPAKLFFIGFNKTGTKALASLAQSLGLRACHTTDWAKASRNFFIAYFDHQSPHCQAFSDGDQPAFRWLEKQFPGSAFVLNTRPLKPWLISRQAFYASCTINQEHNWRLPLMPSQAVEYAHGPRDVRQWILRRERYHSLVLEHFVGADPENFDVFTNPDGNFSDADSQPGPGTTMDGRAMDGSALEGSAPFSPHSWLARRGTSRVFGTSGRARPYLRRAQARARGRYLLDYDSSSMDGSARGGEAMSRPPARVAASDRDLSAGAKGQLGMLMATTGIIHRHISARNPQGPPSYFMMLDLITDGEAKVKEQLERVLRESGLEQVARGPKNSAHNVGMVGRGYEGPIKASERCVADILSSLNFTEGERESDLLVGRPVPPLPGDFDGASCVFNVTAILAELVKQAEMEQARAGSSQSSKRVLDNMLRAQLEKALQRSKTTSPLPRRGGWQRPQLQDWHG